MTRALTDYPRPAQDTGIGMHLSSQIHEQRWHDPAVLAADIAVWRAMSVSWLKLFNDGLSQLKAAEAFCAAGFEVILRLYTPWGDGVLSRSWPVDIMQRFAAVGVHYVEAFNEPELELRLGDPPSQQTIDRLAAAYIRFADACAHAGVIPCTPAFQGDRVETWFRPFLRAVKVMGRRDALEGSAIAGHWRPLNHPPDVAPPGFVFRSYETFDDIVREELGGPLPLLGTEAGYEPGDDQDRTFAKIDLELHTRYNVQLLQAPWRESLFCQCQWLWCGGWSGSDYVGNRVYTANGGELPVIKALSEATPVQRWPAVDEPEFPDEPADPAGDAARETADESVKTLNWGVKYALRHNLTPFHRELPFTVAGENWFAWPVHNSDGDTGLVVYPEGGYTDAQTRIVEWEV